MTQQDIEQINERGMNTGLISRQLEFIKKGFPYLRLKAAASSELGVMSFDETQKQHYIEVWNQFIKGDNRIVKFVPASGAASRMFKNLYAFLNSEEQTPKTEYEIQFFENIHKFAFFEDLDHKCKENELKGIHQLIIEGKYKKVVENLLELKGLGYGHLPKGLLLFHRYEDVARTAMEEHLVEAALYASSHGVTYVHFTVSHEHLALFKQRVEKVVERFSERYQIRYDISFSEQKPCTDTIAANLDNTPFRNSDGSLLFRPGGHGALIENLNDIDADVVFVKNIDNVVPDRWEADTVTFKQVIGGVLVDFQKRSFNYLRLLDSGKYNHAMLEEVIRFLQRDLTCRNESLKYMEDAELTVYLKKKLNRPMRVCGVVRNEGEPGGGPFITIDSDGSTSLQILESTQVNMDTPEYAKMLKQSIYFNPVDLVCSLKDYQGNHYHLPDFVDPSTGFISAKSKDGKELKALELPGLWNGAMSNWNTIFVEVPLSTFNPVKTVNDLLKPQHQ